MTTLAAAVLLMAGCGLTEEGARPGVAAEVDGERLRLSVLDRAVEDYCAVQDADPQAQAAPTALVRAQLALGWVQASAVERLAVDNGVTLPSATIDADTVEEIWGDQGQITEENFDSFAWLTWVQQRLSGPVEEIGAALLVEEVGQVVEGQPALDRGVAELQQWLADNEPTLNPVLGEYDEESGFFDGDALSVPVSNEARALAVTSDLTAEQVNALPPSRRCGSTAPPQDPGA